MKLLDEIKKVIIHIRWPLQSFTLLGFIFGLVVSRVPFSQEVILSFISWFLLCTGITVFNSYYDKDKKPVAGLEKPPKTSDSLFYGSLIFKSIGLIIALTLNPIFLSIYIIGILLSVLYSHQYFRFKSNGYVAAVFNFIIGAISFIMASSFNLSNKLTLIIGSLTGGLFLASIYIMMQIHQTKEDQERGDFSIASKHGRKKAITISLIFIIIAGILGVTSLVLSKIKIIYLILIITIFILVSIKTYLWSKKKKVNDFKIMNKLTLNLSYSMNIILLIVYILEIN